MQIAWLDISDSKTLFPPVDRALTYPDGLLAAGGDLSTERLLSAYRQGIFPWYEKGQPVLWWSPNPRAVLFPNALKISRSLRKSMRTAGWSYTFDHAFRSVMQNCAAPRRDTDQTWITSDMLDAYCEMQRLAHAHSVEVWNGQGVLIGGLYGLTIGKVFFGESMFTHETDASKAALVMLVRHLLAWEFELIDCQMVTPHLQSLGATTMAREDFVALLGKWCEQTASEANWEIDESLVSCD